GELRLLRANLAPLFFAACFVLLAAANAGGLLGRAPAVAALVGLVLALARAAVRGARALSRRWLWLIRRKLVLSYVFIAIVPFLLVTVVFTLLVYLAAGQLVAYLASRQTLELAREVDDACAGIVQALERGAGAATDLEALKRSSADKDAEQVLR